MLVETDFLLALASEGDRHHGDAVDLIRRGKELSLSPYALVEMDLLVRSGSIGVDVGTFYGSLDDLLEYYGMRVVKPHPSHFATAWTLRERYDLTYFDSLHASVAFLEGIPIVSYDEAYSGVRGLRHLRPEDVP